MNLIIFILILVALIVVHEFGHFSVAKLFGIRVDEFGIGFPPRLWGKKFGETLYSVNLLFFGGFVRIFGEDQGDAHAPRSFASKHRLVQAAVIAAGIGCNIIFAWIILSIGLAVGLPSSTTHDGLGTVENPAVTIVGVLPGSPAQKAGIVGGEKIISINTAAGATLANASASSTQEFIKQHQDESLVLQTNSQSGEVKTFIVKAVADIVPDKKALGINLDDVGTLRLPLYLAPVQGAIVTWDMTRATALGLIDFFSQIVRGKADFSSVAGPIGIAGIGAQAVHNGFAAAITLTAVISINLALINVLPIPGLDGGRLLIILLEAIFRRPVSPKLMFSLSIAGFSLLILLMLVVSYHDILRLIG